MMPSETLSDAELAALAADPAQASAAFRLLYERHSENVLSFVQARFPAIADDVAQETWTRAWKQLTAKGRTMTNFRGWLFTIAKNIGTDFHRGPKTSVLEVDAADPSRSTEENWIDAERQTAVRNCMDVLTDQKPDYAAVVRAFLAGEPVTDAAARLGISRANFDQRKKRALDALQECVEKRLP